MHLLCSLICCSLCRALTLKAVEPSVTVVDDPYHLERVELAVLAYHTIGAQHEHLAQPWDCLSAYRHSQLLAQQAGLISTPLGQAVEAAAAAAERRFVGYEPRSLVLLLKDMRPVQRADGACAHRPGWSSNTQLVHALHLSPQGRHAAQQSVRARSGRERGESLLNASIRQRKRNQQKRFSHQPDEVVHARLSLPHINGRHSEPPPDTSKVPKPRQYSTYRAEDRARRQPVVVRKTDGLLVTAPAASLELPKLKVC